MAISNCNVGYCYIHGAINIEFVANTEKFVILQGGGRDDRLNFEV
jgi:hypothetical protein